MNKLPITAVTAVTAAALSAVALTLAAAAAAAPSGPSSVDQTVNQLKADGYKGQPQRCIRWFAFEVG
jgi:Spy/CpxP family protein refolding chaperone